MAFDQVDVQWTLICRPPPRKVFAEAVARAKGRGWSFKDMVIKDLDGATLLLSDEWPPETMGFTNFIKEQSEDVNFSLFWSTYFAGRLCKVTGGLYIKQYMRNDENFEMACSRALCDLRRFFDGDEVLCIVLTLEDDENIDVAPGLVGLYRPSIWRMTSKILLTGFSEQARDGWIEVRPESCQKKEPGSVSSMEKETISTIQRIQSVLEDGLWGQ